MDAKRDKQCENRLAAQRETFARTRDAETDEQRENRLATLRETSARARAAEIDEQRANRLAISRENSARGMPKPTNIMQTVLRPCVKLLRVIGNEESAELPLQACRLISN